MKDPDSSSSRSLATDARPPVCPNCHSAATVTTATRPDADSYWRCTECGEVWNVARWQADRHRPDRWR